MTAFHTQSGYFSVVAVVSGKKTQASYGLLSGFVVSNLVTTQKLKVFLPLLPPTRTLSLCFFILSLVSRNLLRALLVNGSTFRDRWVVTLDQ